MSRNTLPERGEIREKITPFNRGRMAKEAYASGKTTIFVVLQYVF